MMFIWADIFLAEDGEGNDWTLELSGFVGELL